MHGKQHLKHMLIGGVAILAILLLAGVPLAAAAQWAVLLACPLMMIGMMVMMGRHAGHGADKPSASNPEHPSSDANAPGR